MLDLTAESARDEVSRFIGHLKALRAKDDRAALAALRRGLGKSATDAEFLRQVVPWSPDRPIDGVNPFYLVGALFALHPEAGGRGNLGAVFRRLEANESRERRFVALLNSRLEDLPHRLRQAVSLARSKNQAIDYERLLRDLLRWEREDRQIQHRWARAFWAETSPADPQD